MPYITQNFVKTMCRAHTWMNLLSKFDSYAPDLLAKGCILRRQQNSLFILFMFFSGFVLWFIKNGLRIQIVAYIRHWQRFYYNWAASWDFQQCGMCNQQSLGLAWAYAQSDQSLC